MTRRRTVIVSRTVPLCQTTGKFRYAGKTEAGRMADKVTRTNILERKTNPIVQPYPCDNCLGWHVGHPIGSWASWVTKT